MSVKAIEMKSLTESSLLGSTTSTENYKENGILDTSFFSSVYGSSAGKCFIFGVVGMAFLCGWTVLELLAMQDDELPPELRMPPQDDTGSEKLQAWHEMNVSKADGQMFEVVEVLSHDSSSFT